jgi:Tol biopolymer transport system component
VFSRDGRYLYGSSYYTGVSNIFRYELATEDLSAVSNAESGFFRPLPVGDSELIVLRYKATGFVPTVIDAKPTEDALRHNYQDLGAQIDVQLNVMHREPMMLSAGVARGFGAGGLATTEFMLSLQVL